MKSLRKCKNILVLGLVFFALWGIQYLIYTQVQDYTPVWAKECTVDHSNFTNDDVYVHLNCEGEEVATTATQFIAQLTANKENNPIRCVMSKGDIFDVNRVQCEVFQR